MEDFCRVEIKNNSDLDIMYLDQNKENLNEESLYYDMINFHNHSNKSINSNITIFLLYCLSKYVDLSSIIKKYRYDANTEITINISHGMLICKCCKGKLIIIQNESKNRGLSWM